VAVAFNPLLDLKNPDLGPTYQMLRDQSPIHWSPEADLFSVSRYEDVQAILKDSETFSSEAMRTVLTRAILVPITPRYALKLLGFMFRARLNPFKVIDAGNLISLDGKRHTELRKVVGRGFTPRRIADWQPRIQSIVEEHVARMRKRDRIDVVADLAIPLPTTVISEMLGVEPERREDFKHWSSSIIKMASGADISNLLDGGIFEDVTSLFTYLQGIIQQRRNEPRDDLISQLVNPSQRETLDELDVIMFVVLLLVAGNETTTNLIGNAVNALLDHPRQLDRVSDDPDLIPNLIEETLRFEPPLTVAFRSSTRDVELSGVRIPKGKDLAVLIGAANRDERQFDHPDRFDLDRDASGHLGFGFGEHFCLGSSFARLQARMALEAIIPELRKFKRRGKPSEFIDSFLVRGRTSLEILRE
jgi:cytochrome P450